MILEDQQLYKKTKMVNQQKLLLISKVELLLRKIKNKQLK